MYSIQENVRIVIAALKAYNIRHIVVSPGGTNIPISQAVQEDEFFHCYSVVDERSAMYFAIGLYLQTGEIIATSCTSAQATRNYLPGLTEAFYKHVPILAITTSKLEKYTYQEYMQAPDQTSLPADAVKCSFDMPPVTDDDSKELCIVNAKKAILSLLHHGGGPVQLNIRIADNKNSMFADGKLPRIYPTRRYMLWDSWDDVHVKGKRILIVMGEQRPLSKGCKAAIDAFCAGNDVVVYTNHLSNYKGDFSVNGNLLISSLSGTERSNFTPPHIVITIGGQTGDYPLYGFLKSDFCNSEFWRVAEDGEYVDTYRKLTKIFECPTEEFFKKLTTTHSNEKTSHYLYDSWSQLSKSKNPKISVPFSNLYAAIELSTLIPPNSYVNLAILNSLRVWNYLELDSSIKCFSNVAAFGIDGCLSTLIGESINTDELCFMITGDLAFFYDMNALGIRHIKNNVRILLVNNSGGAEFRIMTDNWTFKPQLETLISAAGHNGVAKGWAEDCGFKYLSASSKDEFVLQKQVFVNKSDKPILFEIFTTAQDEVDAVNELLSSNKEITLGEKIKANAKKVLGKNVVELIKKVT